MSKIDPNEAMKKLKAAKAALDVARREEQRLLGRRDALLERLKSEFGFSSLTDADKRAEELEAEVSDLTIQLDARLSDVDMLLGQMNVKPE